MVLGLREIALTKTKRPFCANKRKKGETKAKGYAAAVSSIRTIPSASEFHRISTRQMPDGRGLYSTWLLTAGGEFHPALKQTS